MRASKISLFTLIFVSAIAITITAVAHDKDKHDHASTKQAQPASAASTAPAADKNPLHGVAWLVGGTWHAEAKPPQGAATMIANTVEWSPNKQAIQFVTRFNGEPHYNGFYAWDGRKKALTFFYTSSDGELTEGTAFPDAKGITQEFDIIKPDGTSDHLRSRIDRDGENAYNWHVMGNRNGEWVELVRSRYTR